MLFIGNSHTHTNNLPSIVAEIAQTNGDHLIYEMAAPGNYDFQNHLNLESTHQSIEAEEWDYVVLQESGWRAAWNEEMAQAMTYPYVDTLLQKVIDNHSQTIPILFMTQGYRDGVLTFNDLEWCKDDSQVCTYEGMQQRVKDRYEMLSIQLNSEVSPVGVVWGTLHQEFPEFELFQNDGIHANEYGSYLSGLVLYSSLFQKQPDEQLVPVYLESKKAEVIHQQVNEVLFSCTSNWEQVQFDWDESFAIAATD